MTGFEGAQLQVGYMLHEEAAEPKSRKEQQEQKEMLCLCAAAASQ